MMINVSGLSRNRHVLGDRMWRLFFVLLLLVVGCMQSASKSLFVYVPDHPQFNPGRFVIDNEEIDGSIFETELRKRLSSNQYNKIELSTGKVGDEHFEALIRQIADENHTAIVLLPPSRGSL